MHAFKRTDVSCVQSRQIKSGAAAAIKPLADTVSGVKEIIKLYATRRLRSHHLDIVVEIDDTITLWDSVQKIRTLEIPKFWISLEQQGRGVSETAEY
jgi:hypothetical protein